MKRFISLLLVCVMVIPFGILASLTAVAEETATQAITVPTEPTVAADAPVYYIAHSSWQTYKDGDGSGKDATNPTSSEGWHEGGNMYEKAQGGAIFVIEQKGYVGAARAAIKSDKPILITALDPADNASNIVKVDGEYNTTGTGTGQFGMFIKDTIDTNTDDKNSFFIRSAVIFENTAILQRDDITGIYHVETGGSIVIKDTCDIIYGAKGTEAPKLVVDEGGYAYLHNVGFSSYTGNGTIVLDRALVESGAVTPEMFLNFEGNVVYQNGLPVWDVLLPTEPTVAADAPTYYIAHNGWQTYKDGDGSGKDATNPTSSEGWHEGGNMYEKAQGGAIFVIEQKGYVGADSAAIKSDKPVMFTALDPADNASNIVKVDGEYNTKNSGTGQFGMFMKDTKDTNTDDKNSFFIQSAVIFENTAILQRDDITGIYHVEAGGSIVIKDTCDIIYGSAGTEAPKLVVDAGGYAYLHNVGFSSYTGNGTIVLDSALIDAGKITAYTFAGFEGKILTEDGRALCKSTGTHNCSLERINYTYFNVCSSCGDRFDPYTEPTLTSSDTFYAAYDYDENKEYLVSGSPALITNSGTTRQSALCTNTGKGNVWGNGTNADPYEGKLYLMAKDGGTIVALGKLHCGANGNVPATTSPILFTAIDPADGTDFTSRDTDGNIVYMTAAGNNSGQYGMFLLEPNKTLTFNGDVIFDEIVMLSRLSASSATNGNVSGTLSVGATGTLVIKDTVQFAHLKGNQNLRLNVEEGGVAILHSAEFHAYTGNGILVLDRALIEAGKITKEQVSGFNGIIMTTDGNEACALTDAHRTVDGSCVNCEKTTVKFENATVTLGGILGLNFYTKLDESILSDANTKMRFTRPDGSVQEVLASNVTPNSSGNYVFSCDVAAKEMTENVKAELVTSDGTVKTYNYTVQKYASYIVNHSTEYNDADVELARTLLNYGATAQLMFNHNTDTLANSTLEETDKTLGDVDTTGITPSAKTGEADGVVCTGTSAVWDSKMKLLYYFRVDEGVTPTFKLDGNIVEATELSDSSWGTHFIEVADIYAKDMVDVHTVEVTVGEQTMTVESSVYAYFRGIILTEGFTEVQKNAAKAGYLYGQAAIAYANSKTGGN